MLYLTRRQTRAAMAAATGAAVYLAASEIGKDRLKMTGLFVLASASMAGMVTAKASAKAYSAHHRIDQLVPTVNGKYDKTGGTISGSVTVTGNHTIQGQVFGSGGTVQFANQIDVQGHTMINAQTINRDPGSGSANVNISGGGIGLDGNCNMNGNDIVTGGQFHFNCTGDSNVTSTQLTGAWATQVENRINDLLSYVG